MAKWITREHPRVDRVACPWLIERFIDREAEFLYAPTNHVSSDGKRLGATPYDIDGVELGHRGEECSFDAFVRKYDLLGDPAMAYMARVIRGADTSAKDLTPESRGIEALLDGVRSLHFPNDQEQRRASKPILDALYAYCQVKTKG
ncbi:MAG TPA: chromate resistance protein ChrB domain-containing protein [Methylomirabilota bacterium]|nr:chromate resistance protein ChrB domain-containing protein [Methylomirabilota bacterium]